MTGPNPHEERARAVKAYRLARILLLSIDAGDLDPLTAIAEARAWPARNRARLARLANTREPSEQTWELVCQLLEEDLAIRREGLAR